MRRTFPRRGNHKGSTDTTYEQRGQHLVSTMLYIVVINYGWVMKSELTDNQVYNSSYSYVWRVLVYHSDYQSSLDALKKKEDMKKM